jgi:hypothetical protein
MTRLKKQWVVWALVIAAIGAAWWAITPSEKQRAKSAEEKRIHCSDHFCPGDVDPRTDYVKDELLKFNSEWFIGPKYYYSSGINGASFSWPSKKSREDTPHLERDGASDIVVFLTGRNRWPDPKAIAPWLRKGEARFEELQKEGFRMERQQLRPDLERVRFFDAQGKSYSREFFIATNEKKPLGAQAPSINCDPPDVNGTIDARVRCSGGFFWQPDLYVDFRLHAKHSSDWPEIYKEIIRVLALLKKV